MLQAALYEVWELLTLQVDTGSGTVAAENSLQNCCEIVWQRQSIVHTPSIVCSPNAWMPSLSCDADAHWPHS